MANLQTGVQTSGSYGLLLQFVPYCAKTKLAVDPERIYTVVDS